MSDYSVSNSIYCDSESMTFKYIYIEYSPITTFLSKINSFS